MKKILRITILVILVLAMFPVSVFAADNTLSADNVIYLEDGSYITVELVVIESRASGTKSGYKTYRCRNDDGDELWNATLTGSFTYTGSSATCTASSVSVSIINDKWYTISKYASTSGARAVGSVTMGKKWLGITVSEETLNMSITCSANGTLS